MHGMLAREQIMSSMQSKGGLARAEKLTPDERSRIASEAALVRWSLIDGLPFATHPGVVKIGEASIPCAVLDNGQRVLTEHGITTALGSRSGASKRRKKATQEDGVPAPIFLAPQNLIPFISKDLAEGPLKPIQYRQGRQVVTGYDARVLRAICEVWLEARRAGKLQEQQLDRAYKAELLVRGLADIGIISLVDEATGYQQDRAKDELQRILAAYISPTLLPWTERFPMEFFKEMFRVWGWPWPADGATYKGPIGPRYAGKIIKQVIYGNLPPGVLEELEQRNPANAKWQRKNRMPQLLTDDIGHPHVEKLVANVTMLFRLSDDRNQFWRNYSRAFPRANTQLELPDMDV